MKEWRQIDSIESVGKSGLWGRRRREEEEGFSNLREIKRRIEILQTLDSSWPPNFGVQKESGWMGKPEYNIEGWFPTYLPYFSWLDQVTNQF